MGVLYLVATPIGNLEDITRRALRLLAQVNLIAAEDTRHTRKLLEHYGIHTPLISYHEHNKLVKVDAILSSLSQGDVALVSDAGMPGLNDPGYELVRAALQAGYTVSPVPGASAPLAALVVSGLPTDAFLYLGYLPRKPSERRQALQRVVHLPYTLIFLETPHRLLPSLQDMLDILGDRQVAVARELTKLHEEIVRDKLSQVLLHFQQHAPRGEFTLVIAGDVQGIEVWDEMRLSQAIEQAMTKDLPALQVAAELSKQSGWPRRKIYHLISLYRASGAKES